MISFGLSDSPRAAGLLPARSTCDEEGLALSLLSCMWYLEVSKSECNRGGETAPSGKYPQF